MEYAVQGMWDTPFEHRHVLSQKWHAIIGTEDYTFGSDASTVKYANQINPHAKIRLTCTNKRDYPPIQPKTHAVNRYQYSDLDISILTGLDVTR